MSEWLQSDRFEIDQLIRPMANLYRISAGETPVAFVRQKKLAIKEDIRFYADESQTEELFRIKARSVMEFGGRYDVTTPAGERVGVLGKVFGKSLLRSTWHLQTPDGLVAVGQERSKGVAIARRVIDLVGDLPIFLRFHFDFTAPDGQIILTSERQRSLRDRYELTVPVLDNGWQLDWRVAAAMGVALDALQSR